MFLVALSLVMQQTAPSGVWEKVLAPGVTYRMEVAPGPLLINAVRVTPQADGVLLAGELATGKVFQRDSASNGRETVSATAARTRSLVTVNADFFPFTGDPLGAMVRDGELISAPKFGRAAFCWGKGFNQVGYLSFAASLVYEGKRITISGINEFCGENQVVLNTPAAGLASSHEPATHVVCTLTEKVTPSGTLKPKVKRIIESATSVPVNDDEIVLTFRSSAKENLTFLSQGDVLELRTDCKGAEWKNVTNAIAGGPFLVMNGKAFVPFAEEGFTSGFARNKHPRTAIGYTTAGDVWIVTVDGRQPMSAGATLPELANIMLRLNCVGAINLDGGGSTTLNLNNVTVNRPSEGVEREVANALLVFSEYASVALVAVGEPSPVIAGPASVRIGERVAFRLVDATSAVIPSSEVLWSAQGGAWIDQAGVLRGATEGTCKITAFARGRTATLKVAVTKG